MVASAWAIKLRSREKWTREEMFSLDLQALSSRRSLRRINVAEVRVL